MDNHARAGIGLCLALAVSGLGALPSPAEAQAVGAACTGVDAVDQARTFTTWQGVSRPVRITRPDFVGKAPMHRTAGASLFVPARAGLTDAYLERVVGCQLAAASARGGSEALAVPGIEVRVRRAGTGFRVALWSDDVSRAAELTRRLGL